MMYKEFYFSKISHLQWCNFFLEWANYGLRNLIKTIYYSGCERVYPSLSAFFLVHDSFIFWLCTCLTSSHLFCLSTILNLIWRSCCIIFQKAVLYVPVFQIYLQYRRLVCIIVIPFIWDHFFFAEFIVHYWTFATSLHVSVARVYSDSSLDELRVVKIHTGVSPVFLILAFRTHVPICFSSFYLCKGVVCG